MDKSLFQYVTIILLLLFLVFALVNDQQQNTINVQGSSEQDTDPDVAIITMAYENIADSASLAQQQNEQIVAQVNSALRNYVDSENIETTGFSVYEYKEWEDDSYVSKGYKATHNLKITTDDLDLVGTIISTSTSNGINRINGISYDLSDEKMEQARLNAYNSAMTNARAKAQSIADASSVRLGKVVSVTESTSYYPIYRTLSSVEKDEDAYSPEDVTVTVTLDAQFRIS